jgi:hypothetical protein
VARRAPTIRSPGVDRSRPPAPWRLVIRERARSSPEGRALVYVVTVHPHPEVGPLFPSFRLAVMRARMEARKSGRGVQVWREVPGGRVFYDNVTEQRSRAPARGAG